MNSTPEHPDLEHLFQQLRDTDDAGTTLTPVPFAQIQAHVAALTPQQARDAAAYGDRVQLAVDAFTLGMQYSEQGDLAAAIRCFEIAHRHGAAAAADQLKATRELRDALDEVDLPDEAALDSSPTTNSAAEFAPEHRLSAGVLDWADERAERIVADARATATAMLEDARATSARLVAEARAQADQIVDAARLDAQAAPMTRESSGTECELVKVEGIRSIVYGGENLNRQQLWTPGPLSLDRFTYQPNSFRVRFSARLKTCTEAGELMSWDQALQTRWEPVVFTARDRGQACERLTLIISFSGSDWRGAEPWLRRRQELADFRNLFREKMGLPIPGQADGGHAVVLAAFDEFQEPVDEELLQRIRESFAHTA